MKIIEKEQRKERLRELANEQEKFEISRGFE
jgi:hypothetical protein